MNFSYFLFTFHIRSFVPLFYSCNCIITVRSIVLKVLLNLFEINLKYNIHELLNVGIICPWHFVCQVLLVHLLYLSILINTSFFFLSNMKFNILQSMSFKDDSDINSIQKKLKSMN